MNLNLPMSPMTQVFFMLLRLPAILLGLSMHEYAHALAADRQGDPTPRLGGRLTLNPMAHIDWIGLFMLMFAGFGWAKPVRVNPYNFRDRKYGELSVSLAGPMMNLILAFIFSAVYSAARIFAPWMGSIAFDFLYSFVSINCVLFAFNLLPVPPLDGFSILRPVLAKWNWKLPATLERYGYIFLILLYFTGIAATVVGFVVQVVGNNFISMFTRLFAAML